MKVYINLKLNHIMINKRENMDDDDNGINIPVLRREPAIIYSDIPSFSHSRLGLNLQETGFTDIEDISIPILRRQSAMDNHIDSLYQLKPIIITIDIHEEDSETKLCPICFDDFKITQVYLFDCNHITCEQCYNKLLLNTNTYNYPKCPICRANITTIYTNKN